MLTVAHLPQSIRFTFVKILPKLLLLTLLAACSAPDPVPQATETPISGLPVPVVPVIAPEASPTPIPPPSRRLRLENVHQQVELPEGWAAAEGPYALAEGGTGWTAFNSWGESGFWAKPSQDPQELPENLPPEGIYAALIELNSDQDWERYGPEQEAALGRLLGGQGCLEEVQVVNFYKWARQLRLEVYCGPQATAEAKDSLAYLLENWRFEEAAPGDVGWAMVAASQLLPRQVDPAGFIFPLQKISGAGRLEDNQRRSTYAELENEQAGVVKIDFIYTWDEPPLAQELSSCPPGRCHIWSFTAQPEGEIELTGESGTELPGPDRPKPNFPQPPALRSGSTPPAFLYWYEGQVHEARPDGNPKTWASAGDLGDTLAALQAGEAVFMLRQNGLERLDLKSGSSEILETFTEPALFGQLLSSLDGEQVFYSASFEADCGATGFAGLTGYYNANNRRNRLLLEASQSLRLLGHTSDRKSLLVQPVGCDPSFGSVWMISLSSGEIELERPFQGEQFGELSPRARYFATLSSHTEHGNQGEADGEEASTEAVAIYDLAAKRNTPFLVGLPVEGAHVWDMAWAPDAEWLYISLASDDKGSAGPETLSYGVYRVNPFSGYTEKIVGGMPGGAQRISANRNWLLARLPRQSIAMRVQLESGSTRSLKLPWPAVPGQDLSDLPNSLSPDGNWLLVWHIPQGTASVVHLATGTMGTMEIPEGAVLIGWK